MEQEKDKGFRVTDKRSVFQEETPKQPASETSAATSTPAEEPPPEQTTQAYDEASAPPLPEANLLTLMLSLYTHVQICLGVVPDPLSQKTQKDLPQAKYNIDLLEILQEKTKGNLTKEEEQALESILYEVRMTYIAVNK